MTHSLPHLTTYFFRLIHTIYSLSQLTHPLTQIMCIFQGKTLGLPSHSGAKKRHKPRPSQDTNKGKNKKGKKWEFKKGELKTQRKKDMFLVQVSVGYRQMRSSPDANEISIQLWSVK